MKIREEFIKQNGLKQGKLEMIQRNSSEPTEAMELLQGVEEISEDPLIVEAEKLFGKEFVEVQDRLRRKINYAWNGKYARYDETNAKNAKENGGGSRRISYTTF